MAHVRRPRPRCGGVDGPVRAFRGARRLVRGSERCVFSVTQPLVLDELTVAEYRVESWLGEMRIGRDLGDRLRVYMALVRGQDHPELFIGDPALPRTLLADVGGVNATLLWDTLDSVRFPRHGTRAELSYTSYDKGLGSDENGNLLRLAIDKPMSAGPNTLMLGARASVSKDRIDAFQTQAFLGGLAFLSGSASVS